MHMQEEFEPEYREMDVKALAAGLPKVKWSLVFMAVVSFVAAAWAFVTPSWAAGELLSMLPWFCIAGGLLGFLGTVLARAPWTASVAEPVLCVVMLETPVRTARWMVFAAGALIFLSCNPIPAHQQRGGPGHKLCKI